MGSENYGLESLNLKDIKLMSGVTGYYIVYVRTIKLHGEYLNIFFTYIKYTRKFELDVK